MQYTKLGRSGLSVSRLVLGTMNFGQYTTEADAHAILDRALEHGINLVDTANMYGGTAGPGITEEIIGRWFAQGGDRRERTVLATKLYNSMKGFGRTDNWPNTTHLSALNIRAVLRRVPPAAADRPHRHLPDAPHRPGHAVRRDLGGVLGAAPAGQGHLLRVVELRGLASGPGPGVSAQPWDARAWCPSSPSTTCGAGPSSSKYCPPPAPTASA